MDGGDEPVASFKRSADSRRIRGTAARSRPRLAEARGAIVSRWSKPPADQPVHPAWASDPYFKLKPLPPTPDDEICSCPDDPPIKLMSTALLEDNPIHCLRCN